MYFGGKKIHEFVALGDCLVVVWRSLRFEKVFDGGEELFGITWVIVNDVGVVC